MRASSFKLAVVGSSVGQAGGCAADAIEVQIQKDLPHIEGLHSTLPEGERKAIYVKTIAEQRAAFMAIYGDPFGCERRTELRPKVFGETVIAGATNVFTSEVG